MAKSAYEVFLAPAAEKQLQKLPTNAQKRIVRAVERLAANPRPPGAKKLVGEEGLYRIRVGDYRVIYQIADEQLIVLVVRIADRKDAYGP